MKKWSIRVFLIAISMGWVIPTRFGISCLTQWCNDEMAGTHQMNTIDHLALFNYSILLGLAWLSIVSFCWFIAFFRVKDKRINK